MKILVSAYACEPNKGSEPQVGWSWATYLAEQGHKVWVVTRTNNKENIAAAKLTENQVRNISFLYCDLPAWARRWKKANRGVHLYYLIWQWLAYKKAKKIHDLVQFDIAHHVTFVTARQPSFMGMLGCKFIFGPVSGGDVVPRKLLKHFGLRSKIKEYLRGILNYFVRFDPLMNQTFCCADKIYVTSKATKSMIPIKYHYKVRTQLAISHEPSRNSSIHVNEDVTSLLYVGLFIPRKGMEIGLRSFANVAQGNRKLKLTMIGAGVCENRWRELVKKLGVDKQVEWLPWQSREQLLKLYSQHQIFLFPSLQDSGGMVVLEALANGLPVITFNLGGPGQIVDDSCGIKIDPAELTFKEGVDSLSKAISRLTKNSAYYRELSEGASKRVKSFSCAAAYKNIYSDD